MARIRVRLLALPLLLLGACKSNSNSDAGLDIRQEDGRMTPSRICDAYLTCLAAAEPQSFPTTLQTYQGSGPCWKTQTASAGCERACQEGLTTLANKYPTISSCQRSPDAGMDGPFKPPFNTKDVDILFMIDNSASMEPMQATMVQQFPRLIEALRSPKLGPVSTGANCSPTNTSGCKLPNLRIGVISSDLGAGSYKFSTCETPGGDGGKLHSTPGKLAPPGCATPKDPWISYTDNGTAITTNVQNAKSSDPAEQVKEAFSCIAYLGAGGCGFEQQLESTRKALSTGVNPGFLRTNSILVVVLLTNEDDCSARRTELFDPTQQGLNDPLGPLSSFRCTEFGIVCDEKLRAYGIKNNCHPGLDYLYSVTEYVSFFRSLRPAGNLFIATIGGPVLPFEVVPEGPNFALKASCGSIPGSGGVPGVRLKAVMDGLGITALYNLGVVSGKSVDVNICASDFSPVLQLIGDRISPWY